MKTVQLFIILFFSALILFIILTKLNNIDDAFFIKYQPTLVPTSDWNINSMKIASSAFENNQRIPQQYTCDGKNINPPLSVSSVEEKAKSLVLIVEDPDAPMGIWIHWLLWNIDPKQSEIIENSIPEGAVEGMTSFGKHGYGGPCPPGGTHRYFFKLYALDTVLSLSSNSGKNDLLNAMEGHIIDQAELVGIYSR